LLLQARFVAANDDAEEEEKEVVESDEFNPLILFIKETSHLDKVIGKEFEEKLGAEIKAEVPFARVGKYDGNVIFNKNTLSKKSLAHLLEHGFKYQDQLVKFDLGTDKDRGEFMRNHGRHVSKIILKSSVV
jgi:hypothetical protein